VERGWEKKRKKWKRITDWEKGNERGRMGGHGLNAPTFFRPELRPSFPMILKGDISYGKASWWTILRNNARFV